MVGDVTLFFHRPEKTVAGVAQSTLHARCRPRALAAPPALHSAPAGPAAACAAALPFAPKPSPNPSKLFRAKCPQTLSP